MDLGSLDYWAVSGRSSLHRASASSKSVAAALLIAAVVATEDLFVLVAVYLIVTAGVALARLPVTRVLTLAAYPALFALLFAASRWNGSPLVPLLILGKAVTAAAIMVALIATTPYPRLFALLRPFLPALVADALLLTYRSLFLLLALLDDLTMALRLRGGISRRRYLHNVRNLATRLGLLLVRAVALSERFYQVLRLRGYSGRLAGGPTERGIGRADLLPLGTGLVILGAVLTFRYVPGASQYNGYLLAAALLSLAAALLSRRQTRPAAR